jgi:hypothetical protein
VAAIIRYRPVFLDIPYHADYVGSMSATPPRTIRQPTLDWPDPEPQPPPQPGLDDCCRSGCTPCVFDLYEDAMDRYRAELAKWQARQKQRSATGAHR